MKFLVDECISRSVVNFLKTKFDTQYVQDISSSISDNEVLQIALTENRIIITRDKDFGDMVFRDKKEHLGIILLRLEIKHPRNQAAVIEKVINEYSDQISGNFTIATDYSIKVIKQAFN